MTDPKAPLPHPTTQPGKPEPAPATKGEEIGGAKGPDPTRYGDWQHKGRVSDF